jgi:hypothetical protein
MSEALESAAHLEPDDPTRHAALSSAEPWRIRDRLHTPLVCSGRSLLPDRSATGLVAFAALTLPSFRNPAQSHPWVYTLTPLVGLLAYGGGIALYVAEGVYWNAASAESLISTNSTSLGFWLCAAGWLLATLGGKLLWRVRQPAESR